MLKFKLSEQTYSVSTSWDEVNYIDFARSRDKSLSERLSIYTGIPIETIDKLDLKNFKKIIDVVAFMDEMPEQFEPADPGINVGDEHYIKMEQSRKALETAENQWLAAIEITKIYTGVDISNHPVTESLGYAVFFLKQPLKCRSLKTNPELF